MAGDNVVTIVGNLTRDPELRFTQSGTAICEFGVAVNRRWQNRQSGEWEEEVSFIDVTAWQKLGENAAESLSKGDRVRVVGRLEQQSWEDKNTGEKRSKIKVVADDLAPSLRWATVTTIERNPREEEGGGRGRSTSGRSGGRSRGSGGGGGGRGGEPFGSSYNDEEPFVAPSESAG